MRAAAGRRPRQLRLARRRRPGGHALHRGDSLGQARAASCSASSARRPSASARTTTARAPSRSSCPRASRTCSSTARRASRSAWRPSIPPHNLGEVIDACVALHRRPRPDASSSCSSTSRARTSPPAASSCDRSPSWTRSTSTGQELAQAPRRVAARGRGQARAAPQIITSIPYAVERKVDRREDRRGDHRARSCRPARRARRVDATRCASSWRSRTAPTRSW